MLKDVFIDVLFPSLMLKDVFINVSSVKFCQSFIYEFHFYGQLLQLPVILLF